MALFGKKDNEKAEEAKTEKKEKKSLMDFFGGPTGHNDFAKKKEETKTEAKPAATTAKPAAATTTAAKPAATTTVKPAATTTTIKPAATTTVKPAATTTVKPAATTTTVKPSLESAAPAAPLKSVEELAKEVIQGKWGNGADRKEALEKAGFSYDAVQAKVNELMTGSAPAGGKSVEELAKEVIQGKWGNGADRKAALEKAGYDYNAVQAKVNEQLSGAAPAAPAAPALKPLEEVAKEVIQGKWGNGADRKAALEKAGYDYNAVQAKVNALLK